MAQLLTPPILKFTDANGLPLAGGKLYSYQAGTTTPLATYTDQGGLTPNANPTILDANGECQIWISSSAYKFVLKDSSDVEQWTVDNVSTIDALSVTTGKLANGSVTTVKIADLAVTTDKLEDLSVTEGKLADGAVTTDKIEDGAVTLAKLDAGVFDPDNFDQVEIVFKNPGDFVGGRVVGTPQYPWSAPTKIADANTPPTGIASVSAWSPNGEYLAIGHETSPFLSIYQKSGDVVTKVTDPSSLPASGSLGVAWSPDGQYLLIGHAVSPYMTVYRRNGSSFYKLPDPSALPAFGTRGVCWSPNGEFCALATSGSPYITIYQRSFVQLSGSLSGSTDGTIANVTAMSEGGGAYSESAMNTRISAMNLQLKELQLHGNYGGVVKDTFTKLSDPASLPAGSANGCSWSPNGEFLVVTHATTPFMTIYQRSGSTFTKLSDPATLPAAGAFNSAWSPDSQFLAVAHDSSPYITIYQRSGTTFTKLTNPATLPTGDGFGVAWSPNGMLLAVSHETSPYITIYSRSGTTFTKLSDPLSLPAGDGTGVDWTSDGRYLSVGVQTTPYFCVYKSASTPSTNAFLFVREVFSG